MLMTFDIPGLVLATGPGAGGAAAAAGSAVNIESVWDLIVKGGIMMIPIGICSFIALAVFAERMISLRRRAVLPPRFVPGLRIALDGGDRKKALDYCQKNDSPLARVFAAGIRKLGGSTEIIEKHILEAGQREVFKLRKRLRVLQVLASITPLLGLLGTIIGMILAFQTVATNPEAMGKTEDLAKGIYQAMITTAAGLIVAIPVMIFYHYLVARVQKLVMDIDETTVDFIDELADPKAAAEARKASITSTGGNSKPTGDQAQALRDGVGHTPSAAPVTN